jgi:DNA polymerase-4
MPFEPSTLPLRWLYIDLNSYFASVEQQLQPELRGKPVAIVPVETDATSVIAASYEAKRFGIKTGTPVYEAKKMCKGLQLVLARHDKYVEYHHLIEQEVWKHIPVTQVCSIDEFACRLMDNETSEAYVTALAARIKKGIRENVGVALTCSIGVAQNKYLAKVAADMKKPDGFTIIAEADMYAKLTSLKLNDLPSVGRNMEARLNANRIHTVEELLSYNAKHMRKIWHSVWGEKIWYLLRGFEIPDIETKKVHFGHSHVLPLEMRPIEQTRYTARRLTLKAASRMRRHNFHARRLVVSIRLEKPMHRIAYETSFKAAKDNLSLLDAMENVWANIRREAFAINRNPRVKKVSITLFGLVNSDEVMPEFLFDEDAAHDEKVKKSERLSAALDKLNMKYGRDTATLGMMPTEAKKFTGTKIAFSRIPEMEEFLE